VRLRLQRMPGRAQGDVRPPLAGRRHASYRADDASACHEQAEVVAGGGNELLEKRAVPAEPGLAPERAQEHPELVGIRAGRHVLAAAAEARLDDERETQAGHVAAPRRPAEVGGLGVREARRRGERSVSLW